MDTRTEQTAREHRIAQLLSKELKNTHLGDLLAKKIAEVSLSAPNISLKRLKSTIQASNYTHVINQLLSTHILARQKGSTREKATGTAHLYTFEFLNGWEREGESTPTANISAKDNAQVLPDRLKNRYMTEIAHLSSFDDEQKGSLAANLEAYECHRDQIKLLNAYLLNGDPEDMVEVNERCYEIWGDEKAFTPNAVTPGLKNYLNSICFDFGRLGIHGIDINFHARIEHTTNPSSKVILVENSATYLSFCRLLAEGHRHILGETIHGAIYGEGNASMCKSTNIKKTRLYKYLNTNGIDRRGVLFVGDIDDAGLELQQWLEDNMQIKPYAEFYRTMCLLHWLRRLTGSRLSHKSNRANCHPDRSRFYRLLKEPYGQEAELTLRQGVRIPQEIVSLDTLRHLSK